MVSCRHLRKWNSCEESTHSNDIEGKQSIFEGLSKLRFIHFQVVRIVYIQNYNIKNIDVLPEYWRILYIHLWSFRNWMTRDCTDYANNWNELESEENKIHSWLSANQFILINAIETVNHIVVTIYNPFAHIQNKKRKNVQISWNCKSLLTSGKWPIGPIEFPLKNHLTEWEMRFQVRNHWL